MSKVIIMRGLPGSGKSTLAKKMAGGVENAVIVSADDFFCGGPIDTRMLGWAHSHCQKNFVEALRKGRPLVIVDNTNTTKAEVKVYIDLAKECGCECEILVVPCDVETSVARNLHKVPRETIEKMSKHLEDSPLDPEWKVSIAS